MRDDTPTYAAEEAHAAAHAPEGRDLPGPDELDYDPPGDDLTPLAVIAERIRRFQ